MAKFLHIHIGGRIARTLDLSRRRAADDFDLRERWIEALLAKLEELERTAPTGDDGQVGHPFYGNQYTDIVTGPKPAEAKTKSSVKAALHELLTSGHPFSLEELMAATGSKSKSNLTTAITHLKGANPHPLGTLNILKNAQGQYHLDKSKPPTLELPEDKQKAPALAKAPTPGATPSPGEPKPSAGGPVAKAPATPLSIEENDKQYDQAMAAAHQKAANLDWSAPSLKAAALQWKTDKAQAMAQWKANQSGKDQVPHAVQVFKEDQDLVYNLALAHEMKPELKEAAIKKALAEWKEATYKAKMKAQSQPAEAEAPAPPPPPKPAAIPAATPTGPGVFKAPDKLVPDVHKHITEDDFKSGAYGDGIDHLKNVLVKSSSDSVTNKKNIANALTERLKASHHFQNMEKEYKLNGGNQFGSLSARLIQAWAGSSGDHQPISVSAQLAIRDAFNMPKNNVETKAFHLLQSTDEEGAHKQAAQQLGIKVDTPEKLASFKEGMKDFALAQYHETQDHLAKLGIKELHLVRGMKIGSSSAGAKRVKVKLQPASSFSTNHNTAVAFSGGRSLFAVKVPASQVLGSYCTGYGCTSEHEVVVLAHESLEAVKVGKSNAATQSQMIAHVVGGGSAQAASAPAAPKNEHKHLVVKGLPSKPSGAKSLNAVAAVQALKAGDIEAYSKALKLFAAEKEASKKKLPASTQWLMKAHEVAKAHPEFIKAYEAKSGFKSIFI